jgi:hypothetical protein
MFMQTLRSPVMAIGALVLSLALFAGCETSRSGVTNTAGTYDAVVMGDTVEATKAAAEVMEDMKFTITENVSTKVDGVVKARTARDVPVVINITSAGEDLSKVSIRVGDFGDESMSLMILDKIKAEL